MKAGIAVKREVAHMRHHIEQLLMLEQQLSLQLRDDFERQNMNEAKTVLQLPRFQQVSIVRQILADCAHVHLALYEPTANSEMCTKIDALRQALHTQQLPQHMVMIDALCYFEQWYEAEDARLLMDKPAHYELKWAIAYTMTWLDEPQTWANLKKYIAPITERFEQQYPGYDFMLQAERALSDLADIDQLLLVTVDSQQTRRFLAVTAPERLNQLVRRVYQHQPFILLTLNLQQQLHRAYEAQLMYK